MGFVACAYLIPRVEWEPLAEREEESAFVEANYQPLDEKAPDLGGMGFMCTRSTDEKMQETSLWARYVTHLSSVYGYGFVSVWNWGPESGKQSSSIDFCF
jgi:hypothetical protein